MLHGTRIPCMVVEFHVVPSYGTICDSTGTTSSFVASGMTLQYVGYQKELGCYDTYPRKGEAKRYRTTHYRMVLLSGATVWCYRMVLPYGATVWCYCMVLRNVTSRQGQPAAASATTRPAGSSEIDADPPAIDCPHTSNRHKVVKDRARCAKEAARRERAGRERDKRNF
eukprot:3940458-Rhodomonas_salina.3